MKPTGVAAPKGFRAAGIHCGVRKNTEKKDLALVLAEVPCAAAAMYTTNRVQAAPIHVTKAHLANGTARAIIANSGNANACAPDGEANALRMCEALAQAAGISADDVIVNSTGVIGRALPVETIESAIPALVAGLSADGNDAAAAIMTTDTVAKQTAAEVTFGGKTVTIGAMAKGSGMIHPNMATMFAFITTDCRIDSNLLHRALTAAVHKSFNRISVDGDTSTNDMVAVLASGLADNAPFDEASGDFAVFTEALTEVCARLAKMIARDGEGATKLVTCRVQGASDEKTAERLSMSVTASSLVKTMMAGADANVGRVLCAMGYAGAAFDPQTVDIAFESAAGRVTACRDGIGLPFDEDLAKKVLQCGEVTIECDLKQPGGRYAVETYGCDLTCDYVRINGDYRS